MTDTGQPRRAPELRIPYPLLEYVYGLPGDYAKLLLRLLQRAQWVPTQVRGLHIDAGEVLFSLRSPDVWGPVQLDRDRDLTEDGRVSLLRRLLSRLERDGIILVRTARGSDTQSDTRIDARRDTPATIIRFLKFRDSLWPGNVDATRATTHGPTRTAAQVRDTIPSKKPADPTTEREGAARPADLPRERSMSQVPHVSDVRDLLARTAAAHEEVTGIRYQHAHERALEADRRAAASLLKAAGNDVDTVVVVWRWALGQSAWPRIETLADLAAHWVRIAPRALTALHATPAPPRCPEAFGAAACPEWAAIADHLRRRIRPDTFARFFAPLQGTVIGDELLLRAPDRFQRDFIEDNYAAVLDEAVGSVTTSGAPSSPRLRIRVVTAPVPPSGAQCPAPRESSLA